MTVAEPVVDRDIFILSVCLLVFIQTPTINTVGNATRTTSHSMCIWAQKWSQP